MAFECRYYFAGRDATEEMFLSPSTFNYLAQRSNVVNNVVAKSEQNNKVWMGLFQLIINLKKTLLNFKQGRPHQLTTEERLTCQTDLLQLSCGWISWGWGPH